MGLFSNDGSVNGVECILQTQGNREILMAILVQNEFHKENKKRKLALTNGEYALITSVDSARKVMSAIVSKSLRELFHLRPVKIL